MFSCSRYGQKVVPLCNRYRGSGTGRWQSFACDKEVAFLRKAPCRHSCCVTLCTSEHRTSRHSGMQLHHKQRDLWSRCSNTNAQAKSVLRLSPAVFWPASQHEFARVASCSGCVRGTATQRTARDMINVRTRVPETLNSLPQRRHTVLPIHSSLEIVSLS